MCLYYVLAHEESCLMIIDQINITVVTGKMIGNHVLYKVIQNKILGNYNIISDKEENK